MSVRTALRSITRSRTTLHSLPRLSTTPSFTFRQAAAAGLFTISPATVTVRGEESAGGSTVISLSSLLRSTVRGAAVRTNFSEVNDDF
ncbi:hypothetical protein SpCBS45565_g03567 [Spizellomyces sp. 'palustris']|nr:hypothetical protein SpCBS45565_g03567 [Spizellomyces sp. 'palustris']